MSSSIVILVWDKAIVSTFRIAYTACDLSIGIQNGNVKGQFVAHSLTKKLYQRGKFL
jgi:hypothetical protein